MSSYIDKNTLYERMIFVSLRYLSFRIRSKKEISDYIYKKLAKYNSQDSNEIFEKVLIRLEELGYINDDDFCEYVISSRRNRKFKGEIAIKNELLKKGVERDVIIRHLNQGNDKAEELNRAVILAKQILSKFKFEDKTKLKQKIYMRLMSRGFSSEISLKALKSVDPAYHEEYN